MSTELASPTYRGDLGDGLISRWSTAADTEKIGLLLSQIHRDSVDEPLNVRSQDLPRIMMGPNFPYMGENDFAIVEDTSKPERPIIACTCFWRHQWSFSGIPIGVGRPEYVATDPAYRNRGLVRVLFAMFHARSAAEGHLLQGITGIPYFYRQFGYEFVLDLGNSRTVYFSAIPEKKGDEPEPYRLRPATWTDIPQLQMLYNQRRADSLVWHETTDAFWNFWVGYWQEPAATHRDATAVGTYGRYWMIVDNTDIVVGSLWSGTHRDGRALEVGPTLNLDPQIDRQTLMASLLRLMRDLGTQTPGTQPDTPSCSELILYMGTENPLYELMGEAVALRVAQPYAWYIRIADVPAFIRKIAPVLEERLARSLLTGHSGELKIDFYRGGLYLKFEAGKLSQVEAWRPPAFGDEAMAGCPPMTFLQLLLSYRSFAELRTISPEVWANDKVKLLINTLFPKQPSMVESLG